MRQPPKPVDRPVGLALIATPFPTPAHLVQHIIPHPHSQPRATLAAFLPFFCSLWQLFERTSQGALRGAAPWARRAGSKVPVAHYAMAPLPRACTPWREGASRHWTRSSRVTAAASRSGGSARAPRGGVAAAYSHPAIVRHVRPGAPRRPLPDSRPQPRACGSNACLVVWDYHVFLLYRPEATRAPRAAQPVEAWERARRAGPPPRHTRLDFPAPALELTAWLVPAPPRPDTPSDASEPAFVRESSTPTPVRASVRSARRWTRGAAPRHRWGWLPSSPPPHPRAPRGAGRPTRQTSRPRLHRG